MATEMFPSSFRCDCGHESHFSESTIRDLKKMSKRKRQLLGDGEDKEHTIAFHNGEAAEVLCPDLGACRITDSE